MKSFHGYCPVCGRKGRIEKEKTHSCSECGYAFRVNVAESPGEI